MSAAEWGPADWYVVVPVVVAAVGLLWTLADPDAWRRWRDTFRRPRAADPRDRKPYRRPRS